MARGTMVMEEMAGMIKRLFLIANAKRTLEPLVEEATLGRRADLIQLLSLFLSCSLRSSPFLAPDPKAPFTILLERIL